MCPYKKKRDCFLFPLQHIIDTVIRLHTNEQMPVFTCCLAALCGYLQDATERQVPLFQHICRSFLIATTSKNHVGISIPSLVAQPAILRLTTSILNGLGPATRKQLVTPWYKHQWVGTRTHGQKLISMKHYVCKLTATSKLVHIGCSLLDACSQSTHPQYAWFCLQMLFFLFD